MLPELMSTVPAPSPKEKDEMYYHQVPYQGSYFMFIKKQTRCTTTRFLLPGSYFLFIKKQMSCQSSLQTDDRQALREDCKDATEKHSERGGIAPINLNKA